MANPYPVCIFPQARFEPEKMFVYELDINGEVAREGWVACPGTGHVPGMLGPDGLFYFSKVEGGEGSGITLYRSALVPEEQTPALEVLRVVDLTLPTHLESFSANVTAPSIIWLDSQAAMIGFASYTYASAGSTVQNGVAYCSTPLGLQSVAAIEPTAWRSFDWFAAVEFDDGSYSTYSAGVAV